MAERESVFIDGNRETLCRAFSTAREGVTPWASGRYGLKSESFQ
jgi:hypothetical protein